MSTLVIGSSSSDCKECGTSASPQQMGHYTRLGLHHNGEPGCGEHWHAVEFVYTMPEGYVEAFLEWHPHLRGLPARWAEFSEGTLKWKREVL